MCHMIIESNAVILIQFPTNLKLKKLHSRAWFRSTDLWVMGPARFHCATLLLHLNSLTLAFKPQMMQYSSMPLFNVHCPQRPLLLFLLFQSLSHNNYAHHLSFLCFSTCSPWMGHGKSTPRSQPFCNTISAVLDSIVVSIPACHAGDRGSIPRRGGAKSFSLRSLTFDWIFLWEAAKHAWRWRFCI